MKKNRRIGIPRKSIKALQEKSGNQCAFPGCNSKIITSNGQLVGEVAFIQNPHMHQNRFNPSLSAQIIVGEENLIYLCPNHHKLIDLDADTYTVDYLKKIKKNHKRLIGPQADNVSVKVTIPKGLSISEIIDFWEENSTNKNEEVWQNLFLSHPQIISCLSPSSIIKISEKSYLGGKDLHNKGGNLCDFIYKKKITKNIVIVEIKTPETKLVGPKYRTNAYSMSKDLSGSVVQVLNYKMELQRDFHRIAYETDEKFEVLEPTCIVIAGNLETEILDKTQLKSLELFRSSLMNIEIVTYNELFDKLKFMRDLTQ